MKEKIGLWKKTSKKGVNYYSGKIKIGDKEYSIALFKNEKSKETSPDLMLYMEEKEKEKRSYTVDEIVNPNDFGKGTKDIKDEDLAF